MWILEHGSRVWFAIPICKQANQVFTFNSFRMAFVCLSIYQRIHSHHVMCFVPKGKSDKGKLSPRFPILDHTLYFLIRYPYAVSHIACCISSVLCPAFHSLVPPVLPPSHYLACAAYTVPTQFLFLYQIISNRISSFVTLSSQEVLSILPHVQTLKYCILLSPSFLNVWFAAPCYTF